MGLPRVTTETDAANLALARMGSAAIVSLDDATKRARVARRAFGPTRDALLRRHPWNFAQAWLTLVEHPDAMSPRFARAFILPDEAMTVISVDGLGADEWEVIAAPQAPQATRYLACDATPARVCATVRRDPVFWDGQFADVFADMLAAEIAPAISGESGDGHRERGEGKLVAARRADSREAARGTVTRDVSWLAARRGWRA